MTPLDYKTGMKPDLIEILHDHPDILQLNLPTKNLSNIIYHANYSVDTIYVHLSSLNHFTKFLHFSKPHNSQVKILYPTLTSKRIPHIYPPLKIVSINPLIQLAVF